MKNQYSAHHWHSHLAESKSILGPDIAKMVWIWQRKDHESMHLDKESKSDLYRVGKAWHQFAAI